MASSRDIYAESDGVFEFRNDLEDDYRRRADKVMWEAIKARVALEEAEVEADNEALRTKIALRAIARALEAKKTPPAAPKPPPVEPEKPEEVRIPESVREAMERHELELPETPTLPPPDELRSLIDIYQQNTEEGHTPFKIEKSCMEDVKAIVVLC